MKHGSEKIKKFGKATSTDSNDISEALDILENAAESKRDEIKSLIDTKYNSFRRIIDEAEPALEQATRRTKESIQKFAEDTSMQARETAQQVDQTVKDNPWSYIGGTAAVGLLVGFLLGKSK